MNAVELPVLGRSTPAGALQLGLGGALLGLSVWLLWDFPLGRPWLMALALGLAAAQWRDARAWLLALPVVLAVVDLGAWSGRLLAAEQDALLAVLAGTALVAGHYRGSGGQLLRRSFAPLWLVMLVVAVGLVRGLLPLSALDANAWSGYLTGWNALRIAKGPVWALVFWPLLAAQLSADREATESRLALGLVAALIGFGSYVLWERGFFSDLVTAQNRWGLVATWLDLASAYRITGPFSQMHLGGEAVDGFLVLAWPFALWSLLKARRWPLALLALIALGLAGYAVMVTFTRTTYVAVGVSVLAFAAAGLSGNRGLSAARAALIGGFVMVTVALFLIGFRFGGSLLLLSYLAVLLGGIAAGRFEHRVPSRELLVGGLMLLLVLGVVLALRGMLTSKWSHISLGPALAIVVPSVLLLGLGGGVLGRTLRPLVGWRETGVLMLALALLLSALSLSLSGTHIQARAATSSSDMTIRVAHWERGLSLLPRDLATRALGAGLGTFPLTNLLTAANYADGIWLFSRAAGHSYLRLVGSGNLRLGQRLGLLEPGAYQVMVRARNATGVPTTLVVRVQARRLLELEDWAPKTRELRFALAPGDGRWKELTGLLDLNGDFRSPWYEARRTVFILSNEGAGQSAIEIADARLVDVRGRALLANSDFAAGGDRWFAYNDFNHLAWHLKSLYVGLWFELGLLGLVAFGVLSVTAVGRAFGEARRGRLFSAAVGAALVGFLVLGLTGTLLDVPPLMTLFLLLAMSALWRERVRRRIIKRRRRSEQMPSESPGSPPAGPAAPAS
ncbi:hypothetical protein [uncultured Thiodictyon sp.]|uniref:hypothetical protein n=1 Tax=uncultured Thiodictyon sp. TaxID=1846217 RepID=UPI0025F20A30|nr:hypothetical protein [uncultured Thiodictyon sp.]